MDMGGYCLVDPGERPTQRSLRLPLPSLPQSLPRVPLIGGRAGEGGGPSHRASRCDGSPAATGAPHRPCGLFRGEVGHGGG